MMNKTQYQALAIGQVASSQYNGLLFDYDKIIDRNASQERNIFTLASLSYSIKSNLKLWLFCGNLTGNLLNGNQIKRMVRSEVRTENVTKTVTKLLKTEQANLYRNSKIFIKAIKVLVKSDNYLSSVFANFSRQALITQAEKLLLSFLTFASICSINSWGKRIFFNCDLLFLLPVTIIQSLTFKLSKFIDNSKNLLTCLHTRLYIGIYTPNKYFRSYKTIAQRVCTSMDYLTQPLTEVMIMANRYDNAHLRVKQSQDPHSKKHLPIVNHSGYINIALAKSKVRIETLSILTVTHDTPSVFFCVNAYLFTSMVALVGRLKGRLVSVRASSLNPVNVTAKELETSSGDYHNHLTEAVTMTTTPTILLPNQKLYKFYDLSTAQVVETKATTERQARKNLGKQSLIFIARKPFTPTFERSITWGGYSHV